MNARAVVVDRGLAVDKLVIADVAARRVARFIVATE